MPESDCATRVPGLLWVCLEQWKELPPMIGQGISSAYHGPGPGSVALESAKQRAFAFWSSGSNNGVS